MATGLSPTIRPAGALPQYVQNAEVWTRQLIAFLDAGGGGGVPTTRSITAVGNGITGGGDLSADRTFSLDFAYLDTRYALASSGVASFNGRVGVVVSQAGDYSTTIVSEGTNLYYTDARVRTNRLDQMAAPGANVAWNSFRITGLADPVNAQDAATKAYVDASVGGGSVIDGGDAGATYLTWPLDCGDATPGVVVSGHRLSGGSA